MSLIIAQPKELIAAFVNVRQGYPTESPWGYFNALGLIRSDTLVAGIIYNADEAANICMHIGADDGARWLTPAFLFAAFDYPFNQRRKNRVTALLREGNDRAIEFVKHLGFEHEGTLKDYFDNGDARYIYGLRREQCRFLEMKKAA